MHLFEIGLAFVEGLALIASPCILPVLPLVLSASIDGGRKRPFGIIIGFVLAFSVFALVAKHVVLALGISPETIKDTSLVLLALLGLVLLSGRLSQKFSALTQGAANFGTTIAAGNGGGLLSGIAIGALIGLVWTPCAGPILASVLVQIIRQQSEIDSFFVIAAFALGAGVPMLIIALTGRSVMKKLGFFTRHADAIRKGFGVLILASVAFIASGVDATQIFAKNSTPVVQQQGGLIDGLATPYDAPEFAGIQEWINSNPRTMQSLKGKVVLIDFWTYSCINCVRTLPYLTKWDETYRDKGLVIIGVHAPEFEFEKNAANVKAAIAQHRIQYPVALDNRLDTWTNFRNQYWPAHYLIDQSGRVVYTHFGEGKYEVTEHNIRSLLGLTGEAKTAEAAPAFAPDQTPETYLGYGRAERFVGTAKQDVAATYPEAPALKRDAWTLSGGWNIGAEFVTATANDASISLRFNARKVFLVLGTADGEPVKVRLSLDGKTLAQEVTVRGHTLYELVDQQAVREGTLRITTEKAGLQAYAFTFGG